ncbi:YcaO-like family protein, partial [Thalassolituus sp.]|uniref:YcaO-like family protein n=1 Tax=Thalassolituus sp. TaxID=2030822 RepID=UPI00351366E8
MQIKVNFLDNLRLEAKFDDFSVIADQPIRYKGDGSAPGPFDYFLASSALCAAYFVKVYCNARDIPTENIRLSQNNIVDPENRYNQILHDIDLKIRTCLHHFFNSATLNRSNDARPVLVRNVFWQLNVNFENLVIAVLRINDVPAVEGEGTSIPGKDLPLEQTIAKMTSLLADLGMRIEVTSWRNIVPNVWSLNIRDADSQMCFTNGKGATKDAALASALGEFMERLNCNFFYNDQYFGEEIAHAEFVHYPNEVWFALEPDDALPAGILDEYCLEIYNPDGELRGSHLIDTNSGNVERGICSLPYIRESDGETVYFPSNLIENLFLSNGMSAGNTIEEAQVQCLSEIFERAVKREILENELALPDVPEEVLSRYPNIVEG